MTLLQSEHIILKDHTMDNLNLLHKWFNDEELIYFDDDEPFEEKPLERMKNYLENRLTKCGVNDNQGIIHQGIHKKNGTLIGYCMIANIDDYNKKCDLGLVIGDKNEWGKGYATEVVQLMVQHCFEHLNMNRIGAEIFSFNSRSIRLFENCGFSKEGSKRQYVIKNGTFYDELNFSLLKDEWK